VAIEETSVQLEKHGWQARRIDGQS